MMSRRVRQYLQAARGFLSKEQRGRFGVFFLCLIISASFWLVTALRDTFESEIDVPLQLNGVPETVRITTPLPEVVHVAVRDKGTTLVGYHWRLRSMRPVMLDFQDYDNGAVSGRGQVPQGDVLRVVQHQLDGTTQVQGLRPDTLEFYFNRGLCYRLPVRPVGTFTPSAQSYIQSVSVSPDSVDVYAPASVLDTMRYAYTQALSVKDLGRTTTRTARLMPIRGVKYEPDEVSVTLNVDFYAEKTIKVPVIGLNFPPDRRLRTFPSHASITFRVGSAQLKDISAENFVLAFTYEELMQNASDKLALHLKSLPAGVSNVRITPQEVDYLIEQTDGEGGNAE